jgi:hypothetical protein
VIADFERWVAMGAPDPRDSDSSTVTRITMDNARSWWSFKPVAKPAVPQVRDAAWARNDIDHFILAQLQAAKRKPVGDADRATLVRRAYFDLVGLPPAPAELAAAVEDTASNWFEKVVDRLLQSPHFGERWGRYWLDLARYAESNGNADNTPFPEAWRYRDYVIAAYNQDKSYQDFILEQVAGDLLPGDDPLERDRRLIATGFLALTSKPRAQNNPDYRFDLIADQIDVTSRGVLGLSVMCARCHDHKFDPVSTREYYGLAGIFDSTTMLAGSPPRGGGKGAGGGGLHTLSDGKAMGVKDGKVVDTSIRIRGESTNQGDSVSRGLLAVASIGPPPDISRSQSGRLELAQWLTRPDNPLTARVAVNRIWLHLFGQGIVRSPDNFGALGERPSHPELLDWLAVRFMENGWSSKRLIKDIMLSRTYQLASTHDPINMKSDPDNISFWRMSQRRLDAEATRDAILAVSGQLERTPPRGSLATVPARNARGAATSKDSNCRSVYLGIVRGAPLPEALAVFDVANPTLVVAQREVTTVPAQALYLMNSPFMVEQGRRTGQRLLETAGLDDAGRVDLLYRLALSRPATDQERARALIFVKEAAPQLASGDSNPQLGAWAALCQAMFASAEFRYLR